MLRILFACGCLLLAPGLVRAQASLPGTALIVRVPGDERIYIPLRAELGSYRFRVLELPDKAGRRNEPLAELAAARDAQAALRARPDSMAVELWVQSTGADNDQGDSEELVSAGPGRNPDVLALRVTETMRARGLQLPPPTAATGPKPAVDPGSAAKPAQPAPTPEPGPAAVSGSAPSPTSATQPAPAPANPKPGAPTAAPPAPMTATPETPVPAKPPQPTAAASAAAAQPATARRAEPKEPDEADEPAADSSKVPRLPARRPLLFVEAAPLGIISTTRGSLGPALDMMVQARLQPYPSSSISLFGFIPLWQASLERDAGTTDVRAWVVGGFADFQVPLRLIELSAGLGAGMMFVLVNGYASNAPITANQHYEDHSSVQRLGAFFGRVGLGLPLTRDLRLCARVLAGLTVPELQIQIASAPEVRWGRLLIVGSLGLELALPWER